MDKPRGRDINSQERKKWTFILVNDSDNRIREIQMKANSRKHRYYNALVTGVLIRNRNIALFHTELRRKQNLILLTKQKNPNLQY